ncbi:uncharacterized protein K489DRAFT_317636 [Dissoconium aciculare CBS 342.82]|uniref:Uncharacterized protein n=1 Tax=Dissoconium aciculare CBS 342.82 TaxID=1314786 RepID=A0A6J3M667_9PEZI|nr:uncharacterized protein K489DRAFT_317636 [Dissoconium aciculare CBS 342.82]KAF1823378.1 hypothetical protein K489DRAFT_317636 [Dissoconium aciculare CBS 342.82]
MSEAYERERQNNASLSALSAKVSALRSVTVDIYDNARDQHVIDSNLETFSSMTSSLQGSARRLGVMARQGDRVAILKVAGILTGVGLAFWIVGGFLLRLLFGSSPSG